MREIRPETALCPISRRWRAWEIPESEYLRANSWEQIPGSAGYRRLRHCVTSYGLCVARKSLIQSGVCILSNKVESRD